jgi:uncharacterized protein
VCPVRIIRFSPYPHIATIIERFGGTVKECEICRPFIAAGTKSLRITDTPLHERCRRALGGLYWHEKTMQEGGTSLSTQASTQELIADWVERRTWAVVGASDNRAKFGNRIYRVLRERGYVVYPVNPTMETVEGDQAYPDVGSLPPGVEVLDIVIPPPRVPPVLDQAKAAGITRIWLQPGAESAEVLAHAVALGLDVIAGGPCAMVESRRWPNDGHSGA